ncbi:hypothetical protein RP726_16050 [Candidatus Methylospira mobilis]|nr:hypothetical protein [Candidatus Methylospira mobilis]WNV03928.1 hypothetical protein RP726_16050 [Candidatus Methylospira mobilis]
MYLRIDAFVARQDLERWRSPLLSAMKHAGVARQTCDLRLKRADGALFHAHFDYLYRIAEDGHPALRIAFADSTPLKLTEEDLRIAATAFETQEAILVTNAGTVIQRVNRAFIGLTGYTGSAYPVTQPPGQERNHAIAE